MNRFGIAWALMSVWGASPAASGETYVPGQKIDKDFNGFAQPFLAAHCVRCHDETDPEGDLSLHNLGPVNEVNAAIWKSVWAQVALKEMPPKRAKKQPDVVQRLQFSDWIVGEFSRTMRDKGGFTAHLDPKKGNFVDHDLLFGPLPVGIALAPTSSPARIWRVTPPEHITRVNELINAEPKFDPKNPGQRTHGDAVTANNYGEIKLYFGTANIIKQGKGIGYHWAVKSEPGVLAWAHDHGLKNYPDFYSVNSAEATQILRLAEDVIRYMAYGPQCIAEPVMIVDDPKDLPKSIADDLRLRKLDGLPKSLVYSTKFLRPLTPVYELMKEPGVSDPRLRAAVDYLFEALTFRPPTPTESNNYIALVQQSIKKPAKKMAPFWGCPPSS